MRVKGVSQRIVEILESLILLEFLQLQGLFLLSKSFLIIAILLLIEI